MKGERPAKRSVLASAQQQKVLHVDRCAGVSAEKASNVENPMALHMMHYKTGSKEKVRPLGVRGSSEGGTPLKTMVARADMTRKHTAEDLRQQRESLSDKWSLAVIQKTLKIIMSLKTLGKARARSGVWDDIP